MKLLGLFFATLFATTIAFAQTTDDVVEASDIGADNSTQTTVTTETSSEDEEKKKSSTKGMEKIEVTGSYVKRIDVEGPTPVVSIDKEQFEVAGLNTVSDFMRESPLFSSVTDNGNKDGYFNFRGQHAGSTLILINGIRVPKLGGADRGFYAGVENIPTNVIERVEILKDGSSALYGSDAMAGVMNFITKKDYDGAEYSTRINIAEVGQGLEQNHNLAFGKSYSRGNWFLSTQYVEQRGYTGKDVGNYYQNPTYSPTSDKRFSGTSIVDGKPTTTEIFARGTCTGQKTKDCPDADVRGLHYIREPKENIGSMLAGRFDFDNDISVSMIGIYNRRKRKDLGIPNYINIDTEHGHTPISTSAFKSSFLQQQTQGQNSVEAGILPIDEVGGEVIDVLQNSYTLQTNVEGYYLDTWRWDLSGGYAYSLEERDHINGTVDTDKVSGILQNSTSYSLTGQNTNAFSSANVQGIEAYEASMTTARLLTTGELFDMNNVYGAGGAVSLAVGVEGQWETTGDAHDAILYETNTNNPLYPNQEGQRTVGSAFAEMVAYPLENVEFQMAGRSDTYSDFGSTFNPKFSLGYRPSNKILLRGSWGTNFNAPSVRNMIQREVIEYDDFQDEVIPVTRYRDPSLQPETGVNYNFGTVIQPNKNWTFTIDQWNFEGEKVLAKRTGDDYTELLNALDGDEKALEDQAGVTLQRDANGNVVGARFPMVRNMGTRIIRGVDLNIAFKSPIRLFGRVMKAQFSSDHTHMLERKTKYTEFSQFKNYSDMEWKNTTSVSLSTQAHAYRLAARTLAGDTGFDYTSSTSTEYDFNYTYQIPWWTASFSVGVKNFLNSRPPVDQTRNLVDFSRGFNASQFQALGRRYYVGYSHTF